MRVGAQTVVELAKTEFNGCGVMLAVGVNDSRVPTWESGKFGARLRTATTSGMPVWFRTNGDAGHFNDSLDDKAAEKADEAAFLEHVLR